MYIGIDATILAENREGIGQYLRQFLRHLKELTSEQQFIIFTNGEVTEDDRQLFKDFANAKIVDIKVQKGLPGFGYRKGQKVAKLAKHYQISELFSVESHYLPLLFWPTTWLIHDISPMLYPQYFYDKKQGPSREVYKFLYRAAIRGAKRILATTEFVKKEIVTYYKIPTDKVLVVGAGPGNWVELEVSAAEQAVALKQFDLEANKYFLCLATLSPRKNIKVLLSAYAELLETEPSKHKSSKLVIAGKKGWLFEEVFQHLRKLSLEKPELKLKEKVIFTDYVDDKSAKALILNCISLIYPSLYEGFGMPPLEAMILGKQVIVSRIAAFEELYTNAAHFFAPEDSHELSELLARVTTEAVTAEQKAQREKIIAKYNWHSVAENIFNSILKTTSDAKTSNPTR